MRPWRDYIWMLLHALKAAPPALQRTVWRGLRVAFGELVGDYEKGDEPQWSGFSSTATSIEVMTTFLGTEGARTLFQIELSASIGRDIKPFSLFPAEDEVLLPPNVVFEVASVFDATGDGAMIGLMVGLVGMMFLDIALG